MATVGGGMGGTHPAVVRAAVSAVVQLADPSGTPAYFWLQPAVTGIAALLVLLGAAITVRQRYRADRKDQWWKRTQWALELMISDNDDSRVLGLLVLAQQATARVADSEDAEFISQVVGPMMRGYVDDSLLPVDTEVESEPAVGPSTPGTSDSSDRSNSSDRGEEDA